MTDSHSPYQEKMKPEEFWTKWISEPPRGIKTHLDRNWSKAHIFEAMEAYHQYRVSQDGSGKFADGGEFAARSKNREDGPDEDRLSSPPLRNEPSAIKSAVVERVDQLIGKMSAKPSWAEIDANIREAYKLGKSAEYRVSVGEPGQYDVKKYALAQKALRAVFDVEDDEWQNQLKFALDLLDKAIGKSAVVERVEPE